MDLSAVQLYWMGAIAAGMIGLILGNFATSPLFRLPRGLPITKDKPFCDSCAAPLRPRDLFPVFSWLSVHGACRYCRAPIPARYFVIELVFFLLHLCVYARAGFGEYYLLSTTALGALILTAFMLALDGYLAWRMLLIAPLCGALFHTGMRGSSLPVFELLFVYLGPLAVVAAYLIKETRFVRLGRALLLHLAALGYLMLWVFVGPEVPSGMIRLIALGAYLLVTLPLSLWLRGPNRLAVAAMFGTIATQLIMTL